MFKRLTAMALFVVTVLTCSAGAAIRSDDYYWQQLGDEAYEQMMDTSANPLKIFPRLLYPRLSSCFLIVAKAATIPIPIFTVDNVKYWTGNYWYELPLK